MRITAEDIARATGTPLRTVQHRLASWWKRWHAQHGTSAPGCPVERVTRPGVGGVQWSVPLDAYCRSRGMDPADVIEALSPSAQAA